ncbi:Nn.00g012620.m01.CDS01 [Neocucurbitaria sp. VM-36]
MLDEDCCVEDSTDVALSGVEKVTQSKRIFFGSWLIDGMLSHKLAVVELARLEETVDDNVKEVIEAIDGEMVEELDEETAEELDEEVLKELDDDLIVEDELIRVEDEDRRTDEDTLLQSPNPGWQPVPQ